MRVPPFFRRSPPTGPKPTRYPYHDDSDCPIGQEVQRSGEWQLYEPTHVADTRVRCATCLQLSRTGK